MSKVAIVTDSNSGITQEQGKELGIFVLPMPFFIDGELYLEDITLSQSEFYEKLGADSDISTSQPSPGEVMDLWDKVLEEYEFEPFFTALEPFLQGKKVVIFGSYGWGGSYMSDWEQRIKAAGAELIAPGLLVLGAPDEAMAESCHELGAALAKA